jgi:NADH-quinone oxidoreductase subunit M
MGMPGFSGFPAELTILIGAWKTSPLWAAVAVFGVLVAAAFTLRAIQVSFFGTTGTAGKLSHAHEYAASHHAPAIYPPITLAEKIGALLLIGTTVLIGLKPDLLFNWITPALQSPFFQTVLKGGTP